MREKGNVNPKIWMFAAIFVFAECVLAAGWKCTSSQANTACSIINLDNRCVLPQQIKRNDPSDKSSTGVLFFFSGSKGCFESISPIQANSIEYTEKQ